MSPAWSLASTASKSALAARPLLTYIHGDESGLEDFEDGAGGATSTGGGGTSGGGGEAAVASRFYLAALEARWDREKNPCG